MGDDERPNLTLASQSDPAELEKGQAMRELGWETRELAANLLRVIRGAGRPAELPQQIINLGEAILEVHKTARAWAIWSAIEDTLHSGVPNYWDAPQSVRYETTIARGALQLVASKLVHQSAQEAAGGREIAEGIDALERRREDERRRWAEEAAIQRSRRVRRKTRAPKPKSPAKAKAPEPPKVDTVEKAAKPSSTAEFMKRRQRELRGDD